jgi:hypothetical protein
LLIEIKPADATTWKSFFLKDATPIQPLAVEAVIVQDIDPMAQDQQIRRLKTENSGSRKTLIVEGKFSMPSTPAFPLQDMATMFICVALSPRFAPCRDPAPILIHPIRQ